MHRRLDDLNGCLVAGLNGGVGREGHLRQTDGAWVGVPGGADDLEGRHHVEGHVERDLAEAHVDVEEGGGVALEPAGLDGDGAAADGPFGSIGGGGHTAA